MRNLRKLMLGSAAAALAITALGVPASAADTTGTLVIVQGHPGVKVDICIGAKEQRSGKAYGSVYEKDVIGTGARLLRFYKYNPNKKCGGTLIAKKTLHITPGWDQTVVLTKRSPKIVMFDNASPYLGEIPPRGGLLGFAYGAIRHAAEFDANIFRAFWSLGGEIVVNPAANSVWRKGMEWTTGFSADWFQRFRVTRPEDPDTVAGRAVLIRAERRIEWILVGTNAGNARMILIKRGISSSSP